MFSILTGIVLFLIFSLAFFIYAIKKAEVYEPPLEHLQSIHKDESKEIFYNNLTGLFEGYDHGRLIKRSADKSELFKLLFSSEWEQKNEDESIKPETF